MRRLAFRVPLLLLAFSLILAGLQSRVALATTDYRQAALFNEWLLKAESGDTEAQYRTGNALLRGRGTHVDDQAGVQWIRRAAAGGYHKAQFKLGYWHLKGMRVPQDYAAARGWLLKSAQQGYAPAQFYLAQIYVLALGVDEDRLYALRWLTDAIQDGYRPPEDELAQMREKLDKALKKRR